MSNWFIVAYVLQNASTSSGPTFAWMEECQSATSSSNINDRLYPDVPPIRAGLLA